MGLSQLWFVACISEMTPLEYLLEIFEEENQLFRHLEGLGPAKDSLVCSRGQKIQ